MKFASSMSIISRVSSLALLGALVTATFASIMLPARNAAAAALNIYIGNERTADPSDPNPRKPILQAIIVEGSGNTVSLQDIALDPDVIADGSLQPVGPGAWLLNKSLIIRNGVTLNLTPGAGVTELRLRSEPSANAYSTPCGNDPRPVCDYASFAYLRTDNGIINIAGTSANNMVRVRSWNGTGVDTDYKNGRGYVLAKGNARLDIKFAELSYLGSADGESYGVSWRDTNSDADPDVLRRRVTGNITDSQFHHNYYGVYTYQASNMSFLRNKFYQNIEYGFDPHDYTTKVLVEDNQAYENGNHGFIISRGCTEFVFRRNKSFNNVTDPNDPDPARAHGFMLDPGSPTSQYPRVASSNNILENNEAYGNEGYGLRILGSTNNTIRNNTFRDNREGITVEEGSTGNTLTGNTITNNLNNGIFVRGGGNNTTITGNTITGNTAIGLYIKSNGNTVTGNTITGTKTGDGISVQPESTTAQAIDDLTAPGEVGTAADYAAEDVGTVVAQAGVTGNKFINNTISNNATNGIEFKGVVEARVEGNTISNNQLHGLYLDNILVDGADNGSARNLIIRNVVHSNRGNGIRINAASSVGNTLTENQIYDNTLGGIATTQGANGGMKPPAITSVVGRQVNGTALPNTIVEIFSDTGLQGRYFEGRTTADAAGNFTFTKSSSFRAPNINATMTDANGSTSAFSVDGGFAGNVLRTFLPLIRK